MANYVICSSSTSPNIHGYAFSASGWGSKYANPATPSQTITGVSVSTSPDNATVYLNYGQAWAWTVASGFGTKYTSVSSPNLGFGRGAKRIGSNVFFSGDGTPFIAAYPWSNSTGFGTAYSNPGTLPTNASASAYNNLGGTSTAVAVISGQSPFANVYAWSVSGFGTRYSAPSGISGTGTRGVHLNDQYASIAHGSSPFTHVYQWSDSTGFGTKYANPGTLLSGGSYSVEMAISKTAVGFSSVTGGGRVYAWSPLGFGTSTASTSGTNTNAFAFAKEEDAVFFGRSTSPFLYAYPFTIAGIGSVFTSPTTPGSAVFGVATSYPASNAYSMTANVASFALTGIATGLKAARTVTADTQSFALTGVDATLTKTTVAGYTLTASAGSFSLTGNATNLAVGRKVTATQGSFSLTGIAAGLKATRIVTATTQPFALTGIAANLKAIRTITSAVRTFALTGIDNRLASTRKVTASTISFALAGYSANLVTTASKNIFASTGSFSLTGISSILSKGSKASASVGVFTVGTSSAALVSTRIIVSGSGTLSLSGQSSTLAFNRKLPISSRQFVVSGIASNLFRTRSLYATPRQFLLTGNTTYLRIIHPPIICQAGTFTMAVLAVAARYSNSKVSQLPPRLEFNSTGKNVNLKPSRAIIGTMSFAMEQTACALRWHRI